MDFLVINKSVNPEKISQLSSSSVHELTHRLQETGIKNFVLYANLSDNFLSDLISKVTLLESRVAQLESEHSGVVRSPAVFNIDDPSNSLSSTTIPADQDTKVKKSRVVRIKLAKKKLIPSNPIAGILEPRLSFSVDVSNLTSKAIRAVKGDLVFSDLFDTDIFQVSATINQKIKSKGIARWDGEIVYNEFIPDHVHFAGFKTDDLKLRLEDEHIVYA